MKNRLEVRDVTILYKIISDPAPAYLANKIRKGRMYIVKAQSIKISYILPFVELLPLSVPFFIVKHVK